MSNDWVLLAARLPLALAVNGGLAGLALAARAVTWSGAVAGTAYGLAIYLALGPPGYALLAAFVVLGSGFTRVGRARKAALGAAQAGPRSWRHASANCAVGALCAAVAWWTGAAGWVVGFVGALAAALADTTESELGMLAGRRALLLSTLRAVPAGTEGAVSLAGTLLGLTAALATAGLAAGVGLLEVWQVPLVGLAALLATLLESWLGGGRDLSNELLNLVTTSAGALGAWLLAGGWW